MIRLLSYSIVPLLSLAALFVPMFVFAEGYVNLVGIPGIENTQNADFEQLLNTLFRVAIIAAALIAVVKLILAGTKYVFSGLVTEKTDAKSDIQSALIGLLIILSAVLLLRTINPNLVNLPALPNLDIQTSGGGSRNACDIDSSSAACCGLRGGTYIQNAGEASSCDLGDEIPINLTGDEAVDEAECTGFGFAWDTDSGVCREDPNIVQPLPPHDDFENLTEAEFRVLCGVYGPTWDYDPEIDRCVLDSPVF